MGTCQVLVFRMEDSFMVNKWELGAYVWLVLLAIGD